MDKLILIVDDARFARNITKRTLSAGDYTNIAEATTAEEARKVFAESKPDLTLLDITLPDNSDLTLLSELLRINPEAKIVIVSAIGQEQIITDALEIGAVDFITKPYKEADLLSIVGNALKE